MKKQVFDVLQRSGSLSLDFSLRRGLTSANKALKTVGNMSFQVSAVPSSSPSKGRRDGVVERRLAEYHESVWGDYFLKYASPSNSTDGEGNFSKLLTTNTQGLLSLFEACHLSHLSDNILGDALAFTTTHLKSIDKTNVNPNLVKQPIHKGMPRLEARRYIQLYQEEPSHNEVLLSFAKLDFNLIQEQLQKELGHLTDVKRKFPFARNRLVAMYLWMLGAYFEPEYQVAREILTKGVYVISIIDDIYDVYVPWKNYNSSQSN
uniref:Terpene synthase n=1 Tax=Psidium guajava TaxID=120290 RepID=A0AA96C7I8_PSIGU|nr:terpene synthase [Psidium guajava]